jgi:hypothetical protein
MTARKIRSQKYKAKWARAAASARDAKGLCRDCDKPAALDRRYCPTHLRAHRDKEAKKRRARGERVKDGQKGVAKGHRRCNGCTQVKQLDDFGKDLTSPLKKDYTCKQCKSEKAQARYVQRVYGMTIEEIKACIDRLGGLCELCGRPQTRLFKGKLVRLAVDHDHATGKVRGFICSSCNVVLGQANEDPVLLRKMADYLERHRQGG